MTLSVSEVTIPKGYSLQSYRDFPGLPALIDQIQGQAKALRKKIGDRKIGMLTVNQAGEGVAEMMPGLISLLRDLNFFASWFVVNPDDPAFFKLTQKLRTLAHGREPRESNITAAERLVYDTASRQMASDLAKQLGDNDLLVVHDPHAAGVGHYLMESRPHQRAVWYSHIGTEQENQHSKTFWTFLNPYLKHYQKTLFIHPDFIPSFLKERSAVLYPAIDPLSEKNMWLSTEDQLQVLRMAGLYGPRLKGFEKAVLQINPDGTAGAVSSFNPITTPLILQVSRWDRLKGFIPLMKGFLNMKQMAKVSQYRGLQDLTQKVIGESVLVLAGPERGSDATDPEADLVLDETIQFYRNLVPEDQKQIRLLLLPMTSKRDNALIVNALQRSAELIVQNSLREGFGLTVTEALWKEKPVLASGVGGLRLQIKDRETGILISNPLNDQEVGQKLLYLLTHKREAMALTHRGWLHVLENFLSPVLLRRYMDLFEAMI